MKTHRDIFAELKEGFRALKRQHKDQTRFRHFHVEKNYSELAKRMVFLSAQLSAAHLAENLAMDSAGEASTAINQTESGRAA